MQDTNSSMDSGEDLDDIFKNLADEVDAGERNKPRGGFSKNYENIQWSGLEPGKVKLIRALGANPDLNVGGIRNPKRGPYDARIVQVAEALNDKGKKIRLVLPIQGQDDNHIIWRIINKVLEADWVKEKDDKGEDKWSRKFKHQAKYPDMIDKMLFSGLPISNLQRKNGLLGKGWEGKQFFLMNVIDRSMLAWHKENKHSVLLSRNVNTKKNEDGTVVTFADPGVTTYGFVTTLTSSIFRFYGFWENYDLGIVRPVYVEGKPTPPIEIFNASRNPEKVLDKGLNALINMEKGLTEEEKSWKCYDLDKMFGYTSATKLLNNFKSYLTIVDANLGTHFINELTKLSDEEKAKWDAEKSEGHDANDEGEEAPVEKTVVSDHVVTKDELKPKVEEPTPVVKTAEASEERHEVDMKFQLPGWSNLTRDERSLIESASKTGDEWSIKWKEGTRVRSLCIKCESKIPASLGICPVCGEDQEVDQPNF